MSDTNVTGKFAYITNHTCPKCGEVCWCNGTTCWHCNKPTATFVPEENYIELLCTRIDTANEAIAARDALLYEAAKLVRGLCEKEGYDAPSWVDVIYNCPHPEDPAYLAEAVKAALSLEDYHAES